MMQSMALCLTDQLSRLHLILKPFMLRRIKKDVENEMADKVTRTVFANLLLSRRNLFVFFDYRLRFN